MQRKSCYNNREAQHSANIYSIYRKIWNSKSDYSRCWMLVCACELVFVFFWLLLRWKRLIDLAFWSRENHFSLSVFLYTCEQRNIRIYFVRSMCVNTNGENRYGNECWLAGWFLQNLRAQIVNMLCAVCSNALDENCIRRVKLFVCLCVCEKCDGTLKMVKKNIIDFFSVARTH